MNIGVDIRELERGKATGIGRYLRHFLRYACQARPAYRFVLYGNQRTDVEGLAAANVRWRLHPEGVTVWWDQVFLARWARMDGLDVFFSPYPKGPLWVPCPLAVTIHDLLFLVFPEYGGWRQRPKNFLFRRFAGLVGRRADLVLTDSQHAAGDIRRLVGIDAAKIQAVHLGVDKAYTPKAATPEHLQEVRRRYGVEAAYLLYVGNFKPHKNVEGLLQAYAALPQGLRDDCQLVLAGPDDPYVAARQALARQLGIEGRVRFTGRVEEADLPVLYAGARLFVFPSFYEGFGLPPLEAMACGTAVIAAACTSLPEVVGQAAVAIDPADKNALSLAIGDILQDSAKRQRLERLGLEQAARFDADRTAARQLALIESIARTGDGDG